MQSKNQEHFKGIAMDLLVGCGNKKGGLFRVDTESGGAERITEGNTRGVVRFKDGYIVNQANSIHEFDGDLKVTRNNAFFEKCDMHEIFLDWNGLLHVCVTRKNQIWLMDPNNLCAGPSMVLKLHEDEEDDQIHVNSALFIDQGISAFSSFCEERNGRDWKDVRGEGKITIRWRTHAGEPMEDVLSGFSHPHSIGLHRASLYCISSLDKRFQWGQSKVEFALYPRGVAFTEDRIFVGLSAPRHLPEYQWSDDLTCGVAILDHDLNKIGFIPIHEATEVFDICVAHPGK